MKNHQSMHFKVKLSSDNTFKFPNEAYELLGVSAGDELLVLVKEGHVVMMPKPEDFAAAMRELCPEIWKDGVEYLNNERDSW